MAKRKKQKSSKLEGFLDVTCPRCGSERVRIVEGSFPPTFECLDCGLVFIKQEREGMDSGA